MVERENESVEDLKLDVRAVLAEIGAEEAVAQLEARIVEFEQQLERADQRSEEAERARRGEADVMRARVSDALQVVQDAVEEQREAWANLEARLGQLAQETETNASAAVDALREELTPRVHRAQLQAEEIQARITGELESLRSELEARLAAVSERSDQARAEIGERLTQLEGELHAEQEERASTFTELDSRTQAKVAEVQTTVDQRHGEVVERLDGLRRELDATAGELRAGWNLRAQELEDALAEAHDTLAETIEAQGESAAELERRWIEGTRDIARRIEEVAARSRELVNGEKGSREELAHTLQTKLDEVAASVSGFEDTLGASETRRVTEAEQLRRNLQETSGRLDVLQQKVANAVGKIASELTNKVSSVTGELEALREASVRQEQRLAAVDAVVKRVEGIEAQQATLGRSVADMSQDGRVTEVQRALSQLRKDLSTLAGGVEASVDQSSTVRQQLTGVQETLREHAALRHEVRELAARMAESTARLDETEKLARTAGQAIAAAVRKAREASAQVQQQTPMAPRAAGTPSVPAAERAPLFQQRPSVPRRGEGQGDESAPRAATLSPASETPATPEPARAPTRPAPEPRHDGPSAPSSEGEGQSG